MKRVIYADVLVFINASITMLILLTASDFLNNHTTVKRYVAGAFFGGIGALVILIPYNGDILLAIIKIFQGVVITLIVFGFNGKRSFIKNFLGFLLAGVLYGGIIFLIDLSFFSGQKICRSGYYYFDVSALGLILICISVFLGIHLVNTYLFKKRKCDIIYNVELFLFSKKYCFKAFLDSGNNVIDCFTGRPVIIVAFSELKNAFDEHSITIYDRIIRGEITDKIPSGTRLLPIKTLGVQRMLPAISADKAIISAESFYKIIPHPTIVISDDSMANKDYSALINLKITGQVI